MSIRILRTLHSQNVFTGKVRDEKFEVSKELTKEILQRRKINFIYCPELSVYPTVDPQGVMSNTAILPSNFFRKSSKGIKQIAKFAYATNEWFHVTSLDGELKMERLFSPAPVLLCSGTEDAKNFYYDFDGWNNSHIIVTEEKYIHSSQQPLEAVKNAVKQGLVYRNRPVFDQILRPEPYWADSNFYYVKMDADSPGGIICYHINAMRIEPKDGELQTKIDIDSCVKISQTGVEEWHIEEDGTMKEIVPVFNNKAHVSTIMHEDFKDLFFHQLTLGAYHGEFFKLKDDEFFELYPAYKRLASLKSIGINHFWFMTLLKAMAFPGMSILTERYFYGAYKEFMLGGDLTTSVRAIYPKNKHAAEFLFDTSDGTVKRFLPDYALDYIGDTEDSIYSLAFWSLAYKYDSTLNEQSFYRIVRSKEYRFVKLMITNPEILQITGCLKHGVSLEDALAYVFKKAASGEDTIPMMFRNLATRQASMTAMLEDIKNNKKAI